MKSNLKIAYKCSIISLLVFFAVFTSCTKNNHVAPNPKAAGIFPDSAKGNDVLTLTGSGLSDMRSIMFETDSVPAPFNPVFNTDKAVIFRVPDTAYGGRQNIIFTNSAGKSVKVPFNVLAFPSVTTVSDYDFTTGSEITLTGNNMEAVSKVVFTGTAQEVSIISQSHHDLTIKMPSTTLDRSTLDITNITGTITTTQEFVNVDNAYQVFTDDYGNGFVNASWGPATISNTVAKRGTSSFAATYDKGQWSADGFANWNGISNLANEGYKYFTFWVKGSTENYTFYLISDQAPGGYGNSTANNVAIPVKVPANVWTYYKFPLSTIKFWDQGGDLKQIGWWINGPDDQDVTLYFDDVLFVK